jgi:RimJ/RimL family protein N-acetyltransferase
VLVHVIEEYARHAGHADRLRECIDGRTGQGPASSQNRHMRQPTLYTGRLRLVPLTDAHLELEIALDSDPEVMRYLTGRALSRAEVELAHRRRVAAAHEVTGLGCWVGFAGDGFVGWWVLQPPHGPDQPKVAGEADLGYRLLRRHWRRGYASEGARELIRYGFGDLGLDRIFAQTMAVNTASRATMSAAGLTYVRGFVSAGIYDDAVAGAEQGEVEYEITRSMWRRNTDVSSPGRSR